jgi:repressor LexA
LFFAKTSGQLQLLVVKLVVKRGGGAMFSRKLKALRKEKGLTQAALAQQLGLTQQAVGKWEAGHSSPDPDMLPRLARVLGVEPQRLLDGNIHEARPGAANGGRPDKDMLYRRRSWPVGGRPFYPEEPQLIPVLGTVRAGYGLPAVEDELGLEPAAVKDPERYFYLLVQGDSMEPRIHEGDLALIRKQPVLEDGDLGVVVYGDGEGTLKRFHRKGGAVVLQAFNPAYETLILAGEDLEQLYIIGKVVETKARW